MKCDVGKYYQVPCVKGTETPPFLNFAKKGQWIPILLPKHDDPEIGAPFQHYHLDFRFLTEWSLKKAGFAWVLAQPHGYGETHQRKFYQEEIVYRRMKCKREMPQYPRHIARWMPTLCAKYKGSRLVNGKCPHKGIDLSGCVPVNGVVTCPGHGLMWDVETGKMVE
jgi:hypothetical protein